MPRKSLSGMLHRLMTLTMLVLSGFIALHAMLGWFVEQTESEDSDSELAAYVVQVFHRL